MISREPTIERLAIARALLLEPFGLTEATLAQRAGDDRRRTASTTPTCTSSTRAAKAGAWKKASSRAAASASTRAWACARWPARRPPSPIPTTSPRPRCWTPRAPCAPSPRPARAGASRSASKPRIAGSRVLYAPTDPIATLDSTQKVALLEKVEKLARAKDPRIVQVMAGLAGEYDVVLVARADGTLRRRRAPAGAPVGDGDRRADVDGECAARSAAAAAAGASASATSRTSVIESYVDARRQRGADQPRIAARAGRRDERRARPGLARRAAARGDRPRPGRRLQPQGLAAPSPAASASASRPRA